MREERLKQMEDFIDRQGECSLDTLSETFGVSKITVRRDMNALYAAGVVEKVYGGVKHRESGAPAGPLSFMQREIQNMDAKRKIGRLAAGLINEGDTVFLDSGTTTPLLMRYVGDKTINVITNNLHVVTESVKCKNAGLYLTGGEFIRMTNSFVGEHAVSMLDGFNITKAFIAATGVSLSAGLTNSLSQESVIKKTAMSRAELTYLLVDHSKWGVASMITFAALDGLTGVITDQAPPAEFAEILKERGTALIYY